MAEIKRKRGRPRKSGIKEIKFQDTAFLLPEHLPNRNQHLIRRIISEYLLLASEPTTNKLNIEAKASYIAHVLRGEKLLA